MSLLIKGMDMPKNGEMLCINIYPDGKVSRNLDLACAKIAQAVELPPHGRLIDIDETVAQLQEMSDVIGEAFPYDSRERRLGIEKGLADARRYLLELAPTVIEAEEG